MNAITTPTRPAIEWPAPIVRHVPHALDDATCLIERLRALVDSNTADMQEFIEQADCLSEWLKGRAYNVWMIYTLAGEKLAEIDRLVAAINEATPRQFASSVGRHTRIRRSQDWRAAVDSFKAANGSDDRSNEAANAAGAAFEHMLETRVSSPAELREKLMLISATRHGVQDSDLDEVFRDFDALGWRAEQAEGLTMRLRTTAAYAAAKSAHTEAHSAIEAAYAADREPTEAEGNAEFAALEAWMAHPASTVDEFKDKLAYAEQREMLYWTGWDTERAGIMRDLEILARHPVTLRAEFMAWRAAQEAHELNGEADDEVANPLCNRAADACRALFAAPCTTPGDFLLKAYVNMLGEHGSTLWGEAKADMSGNIWDIDVSQAANPIELGDAWTRSAYADLDASDVGACLLSFGLPDFSAEAWMERADAIKMSAYVCYQADGSRGLSIGERMDFAPARTHRERDRLRRLIAFDQARVAEVCEEIEREWPQLVVRSVAA